MCYLLVLILTLSAVFALKCLIRFNKQNYQLPLGLYYQQPNNHKGKMGIVKPISPANVDCDIRSATSIDHTCDQKITSFSLSIFPPPAPFPPPPPSPPSPLPFSFSFYSFSSSSTSYSYSFSPSSYISILKLCIMQSFTSI